MVLSIAAALLGVGGAAVFAAYRAVSASGGGLAEFASNLAWPGVLIFLAVAAVVWFGWKAELD